MARNEEAQHVTMPREARRELSFLPPGNQRRFLITGRLLKSPVRVGQRRAVVSTFHCRQQQAREARELDRVTAPASGAKSSRTRPRPAGIIETSRSTAHTKRKALFRRKYSSINFRNSPSARKMNSRKATSAARRIALFHRVIARERLIASRREIKKSRLLRRLLTEDSLRSSSRAPGRARMQVFYVHRPFRPFLFQIF